MESVARAKPRTRELCAEGEEIRSAYQQARRKHERVQQLFGVEHPETREYKAKTALEDAAWKKHLESCRQCQKAEAFLG